MHCANTVRYENAPKKYKIGMPSDREMAQKRVDQMLTNTFEKEVQATLLPSHSKDIYLKKDSQ